MKIAIDPIAVSLLLVASLAALLASVGIVRRERRRALHRVARDVESRIGGHGIWTGAWLVAIPAAQARRAREQGKAAAKNKAPPERILDLWHACGGALLRHVQGPPVTSEAEACGWLARASDDLADAPVAGLASGDRRSVFALVYACTSAPPPRPASLADLRERLFGPACIAAAFVACPAAGASPGLPLRAIGAARWALAALAVLAAVYVAVALIAGPSSPSIGPDAGAGGPLSDAAAGQSTPGASHGTAGTGQGTTGQGTTRIAGQGTTGQGTTRIAGQGTTGQGTTGQDTTEEDIGAADAPGDARVDAGSPADAGKADAATGHQTGPAVAAPPPAPLTGKAAQTGSIEAPAKPTGAVAPSSGNSVTNPDGK